MQKDKTYITTLPDFIEIQKTSFCWFISEGLSKELNSFSSILDFTGNIEVCLFGNDYKLKAPTFNEYESKQRDSTYAGRIYLPIEIKNKALKTITHKQRIFIGNLPLMTNKATFIINGCERVIISQIVRSPGIYFTKIKNKKFFGATLISTRGSWLKFEFGKEDKKKLTDDGSSESQKSPKEQNLNYDIPRFGLKGKISTKDDIRNIIIRIDRSTKITATELLNGMGLDNNSIFQTVQQPHYFLPALINKTYKSKNSKLRTLKNIEITEFNELRSENGFNYFSDTTSFFSKIFDRRYYDIGQVGRLKINQRLKLNVSEEIHTLTYEDIIAIFDFLIEINRKKSIDDDIDHLQNRRIRSVGELLTNQFRTGLGRLERTIKERLTICDPLMLKPSTIVNPKPLMASIKEFFGSSQLSQFMDQTNPLSALTHKRRISGLGPGGLNRDRISFAVRDIHPSHYGRICPIETPEGQNAGLIASLTTCARVNSYGFIETPFWKVINGEVIRTKTPIYLTADTEDFFKIAPADINIDNKGFIQKQQIPVRYKQDFITVSPIEVNFIAVSTVQIVSVAAALIPFFEHDDANRALMGSNMQRQSVPLVFPQKPIVGTGLENQVAIDSGMVVTAFHNGLVTHVSSSQIITKDKFGVQSIYDLQKYNRSNQDTCINHKPIVWIGETVQSGQVLADGPGTNGGELALGQNLTVAYMPWDGYNFEDAILINQRLVYEDLFTSIHIEKYDIEVRQTKIGNEELTSDIPNVNKELTQNLDDNGIIYKGSFVKAGDILVGKVTPKGESDQLPEGKLLRAIFGEKTKDVRDTSLRVPNGESGRILDIKVFNREDGDELPLGANKLVRIFLAQTRKIQVGDKIAGRHGNKGIISRILPQEDMPYLPDGTPVDVILNPLGVPSRMNVGQLYECLLGFAGNKLNRRFKILPFDEMYGHDTSRILINKKLRQASIESNEAWVFNPYSPGKMVLIDGRSGEPFENPVTVGKAYMLKLVHLVDDKIHARSTGPYSLVTQQPLGGKSQNGGQRFGEMEVWALEAFGAAYTLQELLTVKSDDMQGRNEILNSMVKGTKIRKPGIPESFRVLMRELQAIGLDISTYKIGKLNTELKYNEEVNLMESYDVTSKRFSPMSNL
jgi:DNA-directed RNA polymerase subunit beta